MKKLRWVMDGGFWDLDISTPITVDGVARPVPDHPLPLGLSRGTKLSRPKQIDFLQRFMFVPFVPSYADDKANGGNGLALQRVIAFPFNENWFATVLGQFNIQKFVSSVKDSKFKHTEKLAWVKNIGSHLCDTSLYALGLCSEFFITPDDTLLVSSEKYGEKKKPRYKAVFQHKFPQHNLTVEAACPGLFTDKSSTYWDVPLLVEMDLASISSDSGASYHLCAHHHKGVPKQLDGDQTAHTHAALQPGLCVKSAFSIKKNLDIWRSKEGKLKMVQPFDVFLSDPHLSISGILGKLLLCQLWESVLIITLNLHVQNENVESSK
ncbi:Trigalactosyldiacylglycerol 4 protein [Thalictrum thalictroides]|uniref:Trigalactosyldiacylglycerol 4 protein n=1 Tax=Thalictrum thalictroides TaxID=46969 RepID=A0A7J6X795_THATH|nr:Trigalactosyldiacylglycerol 4 protein [Thalictrum thalictroides]